jgi:hypothetical protein
MLVLLSRNNENWETVSPVFGQLNIRTGFYEVSHRDLLSDRFAHALVRIVAVFWLTQARCDCASAARAIVCTLLTNSKLSFENLLSRPLPTCFIAKPMEIIVLAILPALLLWSSVAVTRVSVVTVATLFLVATACCPPEFFSMRVLGLNCTIDRFLVLTLLGTMALSWKAGKLRVLPLESVDYLLCLFLLWLTARTMTQPLGSVDPLQPHTLMHLINGYYIPFALYVIVRSATLDMKDLRLTFWILALMGIYLGCTAIFEVAKVWSLVFPKSIADPTLGIHFGRARGPMLQSVRLGVCLIANDTGLHDLAKSFPEIGLDLGRCYNSHSASSHWRNLHAQHLDGVDRYRWHLGIIVSAWTSSSRNYSGRCSGGAVWRISFRA